MAKTNASSPKTDSKNKNVVKTPPPPSDVVKEKDTAGDIVEKDPTNFATTEAVTPEVEEQIKEDIAAHETAMPDDVPAAKGYNQSCPGCSSEYQKPLGDHQGIPWLECSNCGTVHTPYAATQISGGDNPDARNEDANNKVRLNRMLKYGKGPFLDFGCGRGQFVHFIREHGYPAEGFDPNEPKYATLPEEAFAKGFGAVSMIEVIEHLHAPARAIQEWPVNAGGVVMVESSFRHGKSFDELKEWSYFDHNIGHVSIYSEQGLTMLFESCGYKLAEKVNDNVYIFQKQ